MLIECFLTFLKCHTAFTSLAGPLASTEQGKIVGRYFELFNGKVIRGFLGIPYALPPVSHLRFEAASAHPGWTGTWNGTQFTRFCFQYNNLMNMVIGEEDCLYLNVFTPRMNQMVNKKLLDVIVWFHGGSFIQGSANFMIPEYLLAYHDVVFVAVNYRLGPFGFLSTDDDLIPGNNGLKDQTLALQWVQQNIRSFGGNRDSVTLAGSSAGASSVHLHVLSHLSQGLFHKAIMHSGTALQPWLFVGKTVSSITKEHARILGCPIQSSIQMIECLKQRPAVRIASLCAETLVWRHLGIQYGPVIEQSETNKNGSYSFISVQPISALRKTRNHKPLLLSVTSDEGYIGLHNFIEEESVLIELDKNFDRIGPHLMHYVGKLEEPERLKFGQKIRNHFFDGGSITTGKNFKKLVKVLGDRLIRAYVRFAIKKHAETRSSPIYFFKFNYIGQYSLTNKYANNFKSYGVSHGDDVLYILRAQNQYHLTRPNDIAMAKLLCNIWATFADTGKPSVNEEIDWPNVELNETNSLKKVNFSYLKINSATEVSVELHEDTYSFEFWNSSLLEFTDSITNNNVHDEL